MAKTDLESKFNPGDSVGVIIKSPPDSHSFKRGMHIIREAINANASVYLYLLDQGVEAVKKDQLFDVLKLGVKISVCALALEKRNIECPEELIPSGLTMMSDIMLHSQKSFLFN